MPAVGIVAPTADASTVIELLVKDNIGPTINGVVVPAYTISPILTIFPIGLLNVINVVAAAPETVAQPPKPPLNLS